MSTIKKIIIKVTNGRVDQVAIIDADTVEQAISKFRMKYTELSTYIVVFARVLTDDELKVIAP